MNKKNFRGAVLWKIINFGVITVTLLHHMLHCFILYIYHLVFTDSQEKKAFFQLIFFNYSSHYLNVRNTQCCNWNIYFNYTEWKKLLSNRVTIATMKIEVNKKQDVAQCYPFFTYASLFGRYTYHIHSFLDKVQHISPHCCTEVGKNITQKAQCCKCRGVPIHCA